MKRLSIVATAVATAGLLFSFASAQGNNGAQRDGSSVAKSSRVGCPCRPIASLLEGKREAKRLGQRFDQAECRTCLGFGSADGDGGFFLSGSGGSLSVTAVPDGPDTFCTVEQDIRNEHDEISQRRLRLKTTMRQHDVCVRNILLFARFSGVECIPEPPR